MNKINQVNDFLNQMYFDNTIKLYLSFIVVTLILFLFKRKISRFIASAIYKLFFKNWRNAKKVDFYKKTLEPIEIILFIFEILFFLKLFNYPSLIDFKINKIPFSDILHNFYIGVVITVLVRLTLKILDFIVDILELDQAIDKNYADEYLIAFFKNLIKTIIITIWVILILKFTLHQNVGILLTGLSILGAAITLATRESIENIIASIIILTDKPFMIGDYVQVEGFLGIIDKIGMRSTRIRKDDKTYTIVPNKRMVDFVVSNITKSTFYRKDVSIMLENTNDIEGIKNLVTTLNTTNFHNNIDNQNFFFKNIQKDCFEIAGYFFVPYNRKEEPFLIIIQEVNFKIIAITKELKLNLYVPRH